MTQREKRQHKEKCLFQFPEPVHAWNVLLTWKMWTLQVQRNDHENIFCCSLECFFPVSGDRQSLSWVSWEQQISLPRTVSLNTSCPRTCTAALSWPSFVEGVRCFRLVWENLDAIEIKKSSEVDFSGDGISHFAWCSQLHMAALGNLSCQCWAQGFWIESSWKLYLRFLNMSIVRITYNDIKKWLT